MKRNKKIQIVHRKKNKKGVKMVKQVIYDQVRISELGVASINLGYTQTTDYEEQNRLFQTSSFTTTDGTTQTINDVWFATESRDTARDTTVTLKDTVAALPDYRGAGRAGNLSTAMNEVKIERKVA